MEIEHFLTAQIALQVLPDTDGANACRSARKKQVAHLQSHETG